MQKYFQQKESMALASLQPAVENLWYTLHQPVECHKSQLCVLCTGWITYYFLDNRRDQTGTVWEVDYNTMAIIIIMLHSCNILNHKRLCPNFQWLSQKSNKPHYGNQIIVLSYILVGLFCPNVLCKAGSEYIYYDFIYTEIKHNK